MWQLIVGFLIGLCFRLSVKVDRGDKEYKKGFNDAIKSMESLFKKRSE